MNKIGFIAIWVLCLSTTNTRSQTPDASDYFPLQVGNTWIFDLYEFPDIFVLRDTISIIDSMVLDDKTYFLFDKYFTIEGLEDSVYLRSENDKVFRYQNGREELWFDFSANEGDDWSIKMRTAWEDTLVQVSVSLDKKQYTRTINNRILTNLFYFFFDYAVDWGWSYTLAPELGCVGCGRAAIAPRWFTFSSGTINGIHYPDLTTSVESYIRSAKEKVSLSVYPNPFNSATRIIINPSETPNIGMQIIYIYDITGRIVKTFSLSPETRQLIWNGENTQGTIVPSGVYFVVFTSDNFQISEKIVFVR